MHLHLCMLAMHNIYVCMYVRMCMCIYIHMCIIDWYLCTRLYYQHRRPTCDETLLAKTGSSFDVGTLITRIGFWAPLWYTCNKEP